MRGLFEGWHIVILVILLIALFGAKRLPDAARSLGRSARVFKSEVDEMKRDNATSDASSATVPGETVRTEPVRAEPVRAEPVRAEPVRAEPVRPSESPIREDVPRTDNTSGPVA